MSEKTYQVFVYGTLLVGEENHHVVSPHLLAVWEGKVKGFLYNVGAYPALVLDAEGDKVKGEWLTVTKEGLDRMDWLEEFQEGRENNYYNRVWVSDCEQEIEGYVYVFTAEQAKHLPRIQSGSWRAFIRKFL
jgi:gamma-glutamylcyclotransferase (GGCT)/AIG2-like uncharacterized protein YtfP